MFFKSFEFILFPITFFIYFYLNKKRLMELSKGFLVLNNLFFYSWRNIAYLPIILSSMFFNYIIENSLKIFRALPKEKIDYIVLNDVLLRSRKF
jgi:hypothetical protein